jgi:hypothetical protein
LESFELQDGTGTLADSQYIQLSPEGESKVGKTDNANANVKSVVVLEEQRESGEDADREGEVHSVENPLEEYWL